jgi:DNA-directed RNA polymerase specialized sigma24 family protein
LCRAADAGRLTELENRIDLWKLLVRITQHKAVDQRRRDSRQMRGGGAVRGESIFGDPCATSIGQAGIDQFPSTEPTPEMLAMFEEEHRSLLAALPDDVTRSVAEMRLEGLAVEEIADRLQISLRSTERKLRRIRDCWTKRLEV